MIDQMIAENRGWMVAYAKSRLADDQAAEDVVQEALLKASRAYEHYTDEGKAKAWLMRILQNTLRDYFRAQSPTPVLSLDLADDEQDDLYHYIPDDAPTPEERVIQKDTMQSVLRAMQMLPKKQKAILICRFFEGKSLEETADRLQMPIGSVKSGGNAATDKIRNILGVKLSPNLLRRNDSMENKNKEHEFCKDRLFLYAKGLLSHEKLAEVEGHLAVCPTCRKMANAMKKLVQKLTYGPEDEHSRFIVHFPEEKMIYAGFCIPMPDAEAMNARLKEVGGDLPEGDFMLNDEDDGKIRLLSDNYGAELPFTQITRDGEKYLSVRHVDRVYPCQWIYFAWEVGESVTTERAKEAPGLYRCKMTQGTARTEQKDMYYQAIPEKAENIRMKRGNGVVECEGVRFAYADSYLSEGDTLRLEYSYLLND